MHFNKFKLNEALKYYGLIVICYLIELYFFNFFQFIKFIQPEVINFLIRVIMVILTAGIVKFFVFRDSKNFFQLFFILSIINPFMSSTSLFFLFGMLGMNIIIAKIIGDIFTSLILFYVLKFFLKD